MPNKHQFYRNLLPSFAALLILTLTSCNSTPTSNSEPNHQSSRQATVSIEDVLASDRFLVIVKDNHISLIDPQTPQPIQVAPISPDQLPLVHKLFNFSVSPSRKFIVWYSPKQGLLKLTISTGEITSLYSSTDWLNQNPHLQVHPQQDTVYFIDNQGQQLVSIDLASQAQTKIDIPYPFGNVFQLSPDGNSIVFVSGFGQDQEFPEYMITDIQGNQPRRFTTQAPLNKRQFVTWLPDSTAVILLTSDSQISQLNPEAPDTTTPILDLESELVQEFSRINHHLYVLTTDEKWLIYDLDANQIIAQTPTQIASDIHRPQFYPWHDHTFLIEETIRLDPQEFHRLWLSNLKGIKNQIVDQYHSINIQNTTPTL